MEAVPKPKPTAGLRHLALFVKNLEECIAFYTELLDMKIEWQPDADNAFLTSGVDNLALHRAVDDFQPEGHQRLDHLGFIIDDPDQVYVWHDYLVANDVKILKAPKDHRDGARSFYCADPAGNVVQMIYHPPLSQPSQNS